MFQVIWITLFTQAHVGYTNVENDKRDQRNNIGTVEKDLFHIRDQLRLLRTKIRKVEQHSIGESHKTRSFIDVPSNMDYTLYTRFEPLGVVIAKPNDFQNTSFDPKKPTKFITHGWRSSGTAETCISIKKGYLKFSDVNVIIMNWKEIANTLYYPEPVVEVPKVAYHYAKFISGMINTQGVRPRDIHLIGHSLGAHVSGLVSQNMNGTLIGRVTGLDPALIGFSNILINRDRISDESAEFVDIIHTCGGYMGILDAVGHVDFYPNGGVMHQPGCYGIELVEYCSHSRSWQLFADSLHHPETPFYAKRCDNWTTFKSGKCLSGDTIVMGDSTPHTARGTYYLRTRGHKPYSLGERFEF